MPCHSIPLLTTNRLNKRQGQAGHVLKPVRLPRTPAALKRDFNMPLYAYLGFAGQSSVGEDFVATVLGGIRDLTRRGFA